MESYRLEYQTHEEYIKSVMRFGYFKEEAIEILEDRKADNLPF